MRVVQAVLKDVTDDLALQDQGELALPLLGLAEGYNRMRERCPSFTEISEQTQGSVLKQALAKLRLKDQVSLLHLYRDSLKAIQRANAQPEKTPQLPEGAVSNSSSVTDRLEAMEREERIRFRALARRVALFMIAPIPPFVAGTWFVFSWQKGGLGDSAIATGLMTTVLEMFKLIFSV